MIDPLFKVFLKWLIAWFPAPVLVTTGSFQVSIGPTRAKGSTLMTLTVKAVTLVDNQKTFVKLAPGLDAGGQPGSLHGVPVWVSSDDTICSVSAVGEDGTTPVTDGLSGWLVSGKPGSAIVKVTAEGDATPGVDPLECDFNVTVQGGDPTSLDAVVADAVAK